METGIATVRRVPWVLRFIRMLTRFYPTRQGAHAFNAFLGRCGFDRHAPTWTAMPAAHGMPPLVLNLASAHERKVYLVPAAYGRMYRRDPLCDFLRAKVKPGSVFLEIGANIGYFALLGASLVGPQGRVYAFEPEPGCFESLRRNLEHNGHANVEPVRIALADRSEETKLFCPRTSPSSSLMADVGGRHDSRYVRSVSVTTRTLDDWARDVSLDVNRISAMKVDVEGAEVRTVSGALGTLRAAGLPPLWVEVRGPRGSTRAPNTFAPIHEMLTPLGYRAYRWGEPGRRPLDVSAIQGREDVAFLAD
jgi:FkbM family methyltransferase